MRPVIIQLIDSPGGIPLVRVEGEVDLHNCTQLRQQLLHLIDEGRSRIVINLAGVPYLDSAALGILVDTVRRAREVRGVIYLTEIMPFVRRAFEITRLIRIFEVYPTEAEAVAAAEAAQQSHLDGTAA